MTTAQINDPERDGSAAVGSPVDRTVRPWWPEYLMSTRHPETRACTCHPDDSPPQPCAKQYALRECRAEERGQPYCRECGSENLAYLEQYANGSEYKCRVCGTVQMWD